VFTYVWAYVISTTVQCRELTIDRVMLSLSFFQLAQPMYLICRLDIQGVSRLVDITAAGDFVGLCDQKSSYKHVSDIGRLRSYDRLKLRIEGSDY
jgi:hypothetical protein